MKKKKQKIIFISVTFVLITLVLAFFINYKESKRILSSYKSKFYSAESDNETYMQEVMAECNKTIDRLVEKPAVKNDKLKDLDEDSSDCKNEEVCNRAKEYGIEGISTIGLGAAFVDINNDGWDDIWESGMLGGFASQMHLNQKNESFIPIDLGIDEQDKWLNWAGSFADFDNDGDKDLLLLNGIISHSFTCPWTMSLYRNDFNATKRFNKMPEDIGITKKFGGWWGASWADFNLDGWLDFAVVDSNSQAYLYQNFNGTFREVSSEYGIYTKFDSGGGTSPIWLDFDLDNDPDLYIAGMGNHALYRNDGKKFTEITHQLDSEYLKPIPNVFAASSADFNQDGFIDLYLGRWDKQDVVFINQGNNSFIGYGPEIGLDMKNFPDRSENTMGLGTGDINEDGYPDILIGTGNPEELFYDMVFCNKAKSGNEFGFYRCNEEIIKSNGKTKTHGIVLGDPDHDGDVDIFYNIGGPGPGGNANNAFYVRSPKQRPNTATLKLIGTKSNKDSIGAKIAVKGSETRYYHVQSAQGYQSQNSEWLTVSLGKKESGIVEVIWPSGIKRAFEFREGSRIAITE